MVNGAYLEHPLLERLSRFLLPFMSFVLKLPVLEYLLLLIWGGKYAHWLEIDPLLIFVVFNPDVSRESRHTAPGVQFYRFP